MSSGITTIGPAPGGSSSPGKVKKLEYGEYLQQELQKTRRQVKEVDVTTGIVRMICIFLGYLAFMAVLDHWVIKGGLGTTARWLALVGLVGLIGYQLIAFVVPPLLKRINPLYAARAIEQSRPALKNSLINLLQLRSGHGDGASAAVVEAIEAQTASRLSSNPVETAIDRSSIIKLAYVLLAIVLISAAYQFLSPKSPLKSFGRVMAPWAAIEPPTRAKIESVEPGDFRIFHDEFATITAAVHGVNDRDRVTVYFSRSDSDGEPASEIAVPMTQQTGSNVFAARLPEGAMGLQHDIRYYVVAGDAKSATYEGKVAIPPIIEVERVEYRYPEYTGLDPRVSEHNPNLHALEGTTVTLFLGANRPIQSGFVDLECDGRRDYGLILDSADPRHATVEFVLKYDHKQGKPEHDEYQVRFLNDLGESDPHPIRHRIDVVPDAPPTISFVEPVAEPGKVIDLPLGKKLRFLVRAADADFKLSHLSVSVAKESAEPLHFEELLADPRSGEVEAFFLLDPKERALQAGDTVFVWGAAIDNKVPDPNKAETARIKVRILPDNGERSEDDPPPQNKDQQGGEQPDESQSEKEQGNQDSNAKQDERSNRSKQKGGKGNSQQNNGGENKQDPSQQESSGQQGSSDSEGGEPNKNQQKQNDKNRSQDQSGNQSADGQNSQDAQSQHANDNPDQQDKKGNRQKEPGQKGNESQDPGQSGDSEGNEQTSGQDSGNQSGQDSQDKQSKGKQSSGLKQQPDASNAGEQALDEQSPDDAQSSGQGNQENAGKQKGQTSKKQGGSDNKDDSSEQPGGSGEKQDRRVDPNSNPGEAFQKIQDHFNQQDRQDSSGNDANNRANPENKQVDRGQQENNGEPENTTQPENTGDRQNASQQENAGQQQDTDASDASDAGQQGKPDSDSGAGDKKQKSPGQGEQKSANSTNGEHTQGSGNEKQDPANDKSQQSGGEEKQGDEKQGGEKAADQSANPMTEEGSSALDPKNGEHEKSADKEGEEGNQKGSQTADEHPQPDAKGTKDSKGKGDKTKGSADEKNQPDSVNSGPKESEGGDSESTKGESGEGRSQGDEKGSPSPQEKNRARKKPDSGVASKDNAAAQDPARSPSNSEHESDAKGESSGDRSGEGEEGGGQKANQEGTGGPGNNTAADEGGSASNEKGNGATGKQGGDGEQAGQPKPDGESSDKKGPGSKGRNGKQGKQPGGEASKQSPQGAGQDKGQDSESNSPEQNEADNQDQQNGDPSQGDSDSQQSGKGAGGRNPKGGGPNGGDNSNGQQMQAGEDRPADDPNLNYAKKATDLILEKLKDQVDSGQPDQELLDKLKWTEDDLRKFVKKWDELKQAAKQPGQEGEQAQQELDQRLRSLGLRPSGTALKGSKEKGNKVQNTRGTRRTEPPAEYRDQYRAYSTGTSRETDGK